MPSQRKILQLSLIAIVHPRRRPAAGRAYAFTTPAGQPHHQSAYAVRCGADQHPEALEQHVLLRGLVVAHALGIDPDGTEQPALTEPDGASHVTIRTEAHPGAQSGIEQPLHQP